MSLDTDIFDALKGLVSNRVYPVIFPQPDGRLPTWPAIRYTISGVPEEDLCGDGDDQTADVQVQLDVVATTNSEMLSLRLSVMEAMRSPLPARLGYNSREYDFETKTYRAILQYTIDGSSDPIMDSPP